MDSRTHFMAVLCVPFSSLRNANPRRSVQFSSRLLYSTCRCLAAERLPCCAARNHLVLARIRLGPRSEDRTPANPQPSTLRRRRRRSRKRRRPRPRARSRPRRLRLRPQPQLTPPQRCVGATKETMWTLKIRVVYIIFLYGIVPVSTAVDDSSLDHHWCMWLPLAARGR